MAVKIKFDNTHNAIQPILVLATRNGHKIGSIPFSGLNRTENMNRYSEMNFDVYKEECKNNINIWEQLVDFKLIWDKDNNKWYEISVELDESNNMIKNVSAVSLGESELSQIILYDIQINTEEDIEREDYEPTVFFNELNPNVSLLDRILDKAPHYTIKHVDASLAHIQRTFEFDNDSIYDSFQTIAEEINCLILIDCYSDEDGNLVRSISAYDLESYCLECGERGDFYTVCSKCGSSNIKHGYGDDTTIFISSENLADNIRYSTDIDSVKNCFKLEAGDDLMTATLVNCNPNGSGYIWYISDDMKADMSSELVTRLNSYDAQYDNYQNNYSISINSSLLNSYNQLIQKYSSYSSDYNALVSPIVGYPSLMENYYNVIDFYYFLNNSLMPTSAMSSTTAAIELAKLTSQNLSPIAVKNIDSCSASTADSAVLGVAKALVNAKYQVKIINTNYSISNHTWTGKFVVTNYSDEEDTATSGSVVYCTINDNYEDYVKQRITKSLNNRNNIDNNEAIDIVSLFKLNINDFKNELKKYSLTRLKAFYDGCQTCLDILIEQGISDDEAWEDKNPNLYEELYLDYYNRLGLIEDEMAVRESEISIIMGSYDRYGELSTIGIKNFLEEKKNFIQNALNFKNYLGDSLWIEFISYRREDTYKNDNFISDGLNNAELFSTALEFIDVAKKEIYKSSTLQHSISASLKNLLAIKEFEPILDYFEVGNWLRIKVDDEVYRLRLISYEIDYDNLEDISITFSDVTISSNGISDVESVLNQASSMASSYGAITRQAKQGNKSKNQLDSWVADGLALTKMKIVDNVDNQNISWDNHGLLCKEYLPITDTYDDKQLKIINKGLYLTDDNWLTSRAGIGNFNFWNPETQEMEETYGVIADTLVGNLVLSEKVGIYNVNNSITLDENGLIITIDDTSGINNTSFTIRRTIENGTIYDNYNSNKTYSNGDIIWYPTRGEDGKLYVSIDNNNNDVPVTSGVISSKWQEYHPYAVYNSGTSYNEGDIVWYPNENGSLYISTSNGNDTVPNSNNSKWDIYHAYINVMSIDDEGNFILNGTVNIDTSVGNEGDIYTLSEISDPNRYNNKISDSIYNSLYEDINIISMYDLDDNGNINTDSNGNPIMNEVEVEGILGLINANYQNSNAYNNFMLNNYKAEVGQYMTFDENGLTLGARGSVFKTIIDNQRLSFVEGDYTAAYISGQQLYIPNTIIKQSLQIGDFSSPDYLGNFIFFPMNDGSISLSWQMNI